jgi:uridine kinase
MPAGLDGNPRPIRTTERDAVLDAVADRVCSVDRRRVLVGIDGRSGSGKSTFADELAARLGARGVVAVRSTTDSFHRPRAQRLARGVNSAHGYYVDSHQLDRIVDELLMPFRQGAAQVLVAAFDEPTDTPREQVADVAPDAVLVFDGLFLHRPEFAASWDVSVLLEADGRRDAEWLRYLLTGLPDDASARAAELDRRLDAARWPRYRRGWDRYVAEVAPRRRATVVVDNNDLSRPRVLDVC